MKRIIIPVLFIVAIAATAAVPPPLDYSKPPGLSLPAAYQVAVAALGSATNQLHCIGAHISNDYYTPGWEFAFCSTNTPPKEKWVTVEFGGKVHIENEKTPQPH